MHEIQHPFTHLTFSPRCCPVDDSDPFIDRQQAVLHAHMLKLFTRYQSK